MVRGGIHPLSQLGHSLNTDLLLLNQGPLLDIEYQVKIKFQFLFAAIPFQIRLYGRYGINFLCNIYMKFAVTWQDTGNQCVVGVWGVNGCGYRGLKTGNQSVYIGWGDACWRDARASASRASAVLALPSAAASSALCWSAAPC